MFSTRNRWQVRRCIHCPYPPRDTNDIRQIIFHSKPAQSALLLPQILLCDAKARTNRTMLVRNSASRREMQQFDTQIYFYDNSVIDCATRVSHRLNAE
ncbi:MAG: hypothetical protein CBB90_10915 [Gammaproteobacteria bacterium TMED30]|nr:MAG: hypothetical protein CBB90_10915 [Gammaproteobacteria bacterium TMED30]